MSKKSATDSKIVIAGHDYFDRIIMTDPMIDNTSDYPDGSVKDWEKLLSVTAHVRVRAPHHSSYVGQGSYIVGANLRVSESFYDFVTVANPVTNPTIVGSNIDADLSGLTISDKGIVNEQWDKIENVQASIVGFSDEYITLECLIDEAKKMYERRTFPVNLLKGVVKMAEGELVLIKIFQRAGELRFKFVSGKGIVRSELFEKTGALDEVFKRIPKGKYDQHYKVNPR